MPKIRGGALFIEKCDKIEIIGCHFNFNHAFGAAICFLNITNDISIISTQFNNNSAWIYGGAIYLKGSG